MQSLHNPFPCYFLIQTNFISPLDYCSTSQLGIYFHAYAMERGYWDPNGFLEISFISLVSESFPRLLWVCL
jgi:hypothetical protein